MLWSRLVPVTLLLLQVAYPAVAQKIEKTPIPYTSPSSGKDMFNNYCAVCHGKDAKGDGPAASALKEAPADLTTLAQRNKGKFPSAHVSTMILGEADLPAHGSREMPVWGPLFRSLDSQGDLIVHQRVASLTEYIKSLQVK